MPGRVSGATGCCLRYNPISTTPTPRQRTAFSERILSNHERDGSSRRSTPVQFLPVTPAISHTLKRRRLTIQVTLPAIVISGFYDFVVQVAGAAVDIDSVVLKIRKIPYVLNTDTMTAFVLS